MITSTANARLKRVRRLLANSRYRRNEGCFVAEGVRMVSETPPERVEELYVSESLFAEAAEGLHPCHRLLTGCDGGCIETVRDDVFASLSDTVTPQGILAVVRMEDDGRERIYGGTPLILVPCGIRDPGNLGTMIRTAEGAGVSGVVMSGDTVDIYSPKVVRATMGSLYRVPFVRTEDIAAELSYMRSHGIRIFGAALGGGIVYDSCDYTEGCAILIGNEAAGLPEELLSLCDERVYIPMQGRLESLNAAISAGILVYEASGQRRRGIAFGA